MVLEFELVDHSAQSYTSFREITTDSVLKVSLNFGSVLSFPWSRPNKSSHEVEVDSNEILSESITRYNQSGMH